MCKGSIIIFLLLSFLSLSVFHQAAEGGEIDLHFRGETVSAKMVEVPLPDFLDRLMRERGIWVKGAETLSDEKISVEFSDLLLEEGFQRIFSGLNYSLFFDRQGALVGIMFLGRSNPESDRFRRSVPSRRTYSRPSPRR